MGDVQSSFAVQEMGEDVHHQLLNVQDLYNTPVYIIYMGVYMVVAMFVYVWIMT